MKKLIKNVVELDMTRATPESVEGLTVKNAVMTIVTPETRPLLSHIKFDNMVKVIELPAGVSISKANGVVTLSGDIQTDSDSAFKVINGILLIKNDVTEKTLSSMFKYGGMANGHIIVPERLSATLMSAGITHNGVTSTYPEDSLIYTGDITINNGMLSGLQHDSKIVVTGDIDIQQETDPELFARSLSSLMVFGDVIMRKGISGAFYKIASHYDAVTVVPDGYEIRNSGIEISPRSMMSCKNKRIYTRGNVVISDTMTAQNIQDTNFRIKTTASVICPVELADCVFDMVEAENFYTYTGALTIVKDELEITREYLNSEARCNYLVKGEVNIAQDVTVDALEEKFADVMLFGSISLYQNQKRVIAKKITANHGSVDVVDESKPVDNDDAEYDTVIANAVEYVL